MSSSTLILPPGLIQVPVSDDSVFWALIGGMHGISRIAPAHATIRRRKIGITFGLIVSDVTVAGAPSIQPYGIVDTAFSAVVLWGLLTGWFGGQKLET